MMFQKPFLRMLAGITLGALIALMVFPQTRGIFALPAYLYIQLGNTSFARAQRQKQTETLAARHPDNFLIQYTAARDNDRQEDPGTTLQALVSRFPDNAALRANILRYDLMYIHLQEGTLPDESLPATNSRGSIGAPPVPKHRLALYLADARAGKALDPHNAYFPLLLAAGLYADHRYAECQEAVLQAGRCSRWNGYVATDVRAEWKTAELPSLPKEAILKTAIYAAELYPHYAALRQLTRIIIAQAVFDETHGKVQQGIALRQAMIQCGSLMRADSKTLAGSLVGIAIVQKSLSRPGGAGLAWDNENGFNIDLPIMARITASYTRYLSLHGAGSQIAWTEQQAAASKKAYLILHRLVSPTVQQAMTKQNNLLFSSLLTLIVLSNIFWIAALWLVVWWGHTLRKQRLAEPLPAKSTQVGALVLTLAAFCLAAWTTHMTIAFYQIMSWFSSPSVFSWMFPPSSSSVISWPPPLSTTMAVLVPACLGVSLAVLILSLLLSRRFPWKQTALTAAPYAVCLALLLFCGTAVGLARQEQISNHALNHIVSGEGQYLAQTTGQQWPGVVHESSPVSIDMSDIASLRP